MILTAQAPVLYVLILSIAFQTAAAVMAIRLIGVTGKRLAWTLIAAALTLMAVRRVVPLVHLTSGNLPAGPDFLNEFVGLLLSALMVAGIARIGPIFAERRQAEKRLQDSEERLRLTLEAARIGTWDWDVEHDRWHASPMYHTMLGYPPDSGPADRSVWFERIHPDDRKNVGDKIQDVLSRNFSDYTYEARIRHADGSYRWQYVHGFGIQRGTNGQVTRMLGIRMDIDERKAMEKALQDSEAIYHSVVTGMDEGVVFQTTDGATSALNPAAQRILGLPAEQIIGPNFASPMAIHEDGTPFPVEQHPSMVTLRTGQAQANVVMGIRRPDATLAWISVNSQPLIAAGETKPYAAVTTFHDISEVRSAKDELQRSNNLLRAVIEAAPTAIVGFDPDGNVHGVWNPAAEKMLGWRADEVMGRPLPSATAEAQADFKPVLDAMRAGQAVNGIEARRQRRDGTKIDYTIYASPVGDAEGHISGNVAVLVDITGRKLAEKKLREYAQIVESSDDAIVGKSLDGIVTSWNRGAERLFGYHADDMVGKSVNLLIPDDRVAEEWMILDEIRQGHAVKHYQTVRRCKDGRLIDVSVTVSPIRDASGRLVGASKIARDISEQKRADRELRQYREHLEELVAERTGALAAANRELEAFSYSVSHDLRTPLRAIDGFSRMLLAKHADSLGSEGQRLVRVVRDNTGRMAQLIDDLLAFSRSGRLEMHPGSVDMHDLVESVWSELEPTREGRDVQFELGPLPPAQGDVAMLRQVWANLLGNAIKFTKARATAHIRVGGATESGQCVYHVRDDGAGFDQAYAHKLFGVFQRLHGVEEFEGTGIGLAIVKRIVSRHGGTVSAEGKVDAGACFRFTLPTTTA